MPTKGPRKELRAVDRALIQAVMFEQGILPMERTTLDMRRVLQQLPPDEARVLRRKFRKLWRRAMREEVGTGKLASTRGKAAEQRLGVGKHVPSRVERNARKQLVFDRLWKQLIEPLVRNFENAAPNGKQVA
jgi:hypothetical protein